jgi:hypothetical protein
MITLGWTFLQEIYVSADWERDVFNISQAIFSASMPKPELVTIEPLEERAVVLTSGGSEKISSGLLGGIIGGAIALLLLLAAETAQKVEEVPEYSYFVPQSLEKIQVQGQTDAELEIRIVGELPTPHHSGQPNDSQKHVYSTNAAELDRTGTIYEFPSETLRR